MNNHHSHEKDGQAHLWGIGLVAFIILGGFIASIWVSCHQPKPTGLVPQGCPSTLVTITVYIDNKQYSWQQRDTARSFDFELPHKIRVEVKPEKEYY